jgi:signal transduction histidine kinase
LTVRLGLRARYVAVLAFVSALTLAVAAFALFSPLDRQLRDAERDALTATVRTELGDFADLPASALRPNSARLKTAMRGLRRSGAEVAILDGSGRLLATTDPDRGESFAAAREALRTGRPQQIITRSGRDTEVQAAIPFTTEGRRAVISARRRLDDVRAVSGVVRRAFAVAAVAGLLGALLVGVIIAGRTAGRIRRLRDTAERVAQVGPVAEFQPESGRDEIGDLSRTFAFMQGRLREQEQARRAFVSTASHELRTPVASLQVMLDLLISDLEAEPLDIEDARKQARDADEQTARLSQLAGELLDLSRIDAGLALRREPVALGEVLRSVVAELDVRLAAQGRGVVVPDGDDRWALADPGTVARILRILLDNALRHTPAASGVRAAVIASGDRAGVAVEDDGRGVAPEDRERIFERFSRGAAAEAGGFGLGLAIGRETARRMGGDLVLDETPEGARFVLWLPAATPP